MITRIQWQSPGLFWISMLALAMALAAGLVFYRPQVRPLQRLAAWVWLLPWVRTLGLGVLALALLRPAIMSPIRDDGKGIVAVLIDRSESMSAVDTGRRPEELVRIAAGLGLLNDSARPEDLSQLRERIADLARLADEMERANAELKYALLAGRGAGMEAAQAHVHEASSKLEDAIKTAAASASPPLRETIAKIGSGDASQQISETLKQIDAQQGTADLELYQNNASVREICDNIAAKSRIQLVADSLAPEAFKNVQDQRPVQIFADASSAPLSAQFDLTTLIADENHTDLVGQLRELHRHLTGRHVSAVVFFSDGRENNQTSPVDAMVDWPEVPLIAVDTGSQQPKDLSIERISVPASVAVGETIHVRGSVRRSGFDPVVVDVTFTADRQQQVRQVNLLKDSTDVEFTFTPEHPGPCRISFAVAAQNGEATPENNRVNRTIKVTADRSAVALIAGPATRDILQLRSILKNSPGIAMLDGSIESGKCALTQADLRGADVVILSDVPLSALDARQWDAVNSVVTQRGGSIIICAGEAAILASYAEQPLLASMLPWRGDTPPAWRASPGETPAFRVAPADAGEFETIKLSNMPQENRFRWNRMPPISRIMSLPPLRQDARMILSEHDAALPVLVQVKSGAGKAFFIATDEIWQWQNVGGEEPQEQGRFWKELIRLAGHEPYAITEGELSLDADRLSLEPGDSLTVRTRVPATGAKLTIERNGASFQETSISANDAPKMVINDLDAGDYTLRLSANSREVSLPIVVAARDENEMRDVSGDQYELRRITGSRGAVLTLAELPSLPQKLDQLQITEARFNEMRLWDSPYLFMFVISCFGVEWALRKHVGLT